MAISESQFPTSDDIIRDILKEHRGDWFVEYHCANRHLPCAILNVVFMKRSKDFAFVRETMEKEMSLWLARYSTPLMVYGVDEREDNINFPPNFGERMITAYLDPKTNRVVSCWGLMNVGQFPKEQLTREYLDLIYADVPFRRLSDIRAEVDKKHRIQMRGVTLVLFFVVVVPVLIELIALGVSWLGYVLSAISIGIGVSKIAKTFGWVKQSEVDAKKAEEELKMKHHHYHCARNPRAFEKLRAENFAKNSEERLRKESEDLALESDLNKIQ